MTRLILTFIALCVSVSAQAQGRIEPLDRIVATVNDDVIAESELERALRTVVQQLRERGTRLPPEPVLKRQVLERLVLTRLQLQLAESTGVQTEDDLLNEAVRNLAQRNGLSLAQFRSVLERDGYDFASFREDIREKLTLERLRRRQVDNRITVSEREVEDLLDNAGSRLGEDREYRLGHILIAVPEAASPEEIEAARGRAQGVLRDLQDGADFEQTAVAVSDGQEALEGGVLDWRKGRQLSSLLAEVVPELEKGEVSDQLLRSAGGFHIIKLIDVRAGKQYVVRQTHARHILLRPDEVTSSEEARVRLEQIRTRILGGDDFADLARAHSQDRASAVQGGDLGWVSPGDVVPAFERVMDQLEPGAISEPFESSFGWHIVQVLERRNHDSTDEVRRAKAREVLRERKLDEETEAWLRRLRDESFVEYHLEE